MISLTLNKCESFNKLYWFYFASGGAFKFNIAVWEINVAFVISKDEQTKKTYKSIELCCCSRSGLTKWFIYFFIWNTYS